MFFSDIHTRIRFFFLMFLCILIIIMIRVFYIQVFQKVLATKLSTTSLVLIPNQIKNKEESCQ